MNDLDLIAQLDRIASALERLAPLGDYAQTMLIQARGEKVWEVGGWVLATTSKGDDCAYLYAAHPGLKFRVSTVYVERFDDLPFDPYAAAKRYDGEAPPTKEGAMNRGLYNECPLFKISTLPTGKVNDDGDPEHRFNRVLDAPTSRRQDTIAGAEASVGFARPKPANGQGQHAEQQAAPFQDAAVILGEIERITATKAKRFPGPAKPETYVLLKQNVEQYVEDKNARIQVLAYLLSAQAASVAKPDWLPSGARCAAVLDYLSAKDELGKPILPVHVATGRVRDLGTISALAAEQPKF